jgi:hypothetical protein
LKDVLRAMTKKRIAKQWSGRNGVSMFVFKDSVSMYLVAPVHWQWSAGVK